MYYENIIERRSALTIEIEEEYFVLSLNLKIVYGKFTATRY